MNSILFIDLKSAFDSLSWHQLSTKLAHQKFPTDLIVTIQVLYHSAPLAINRQSQKIQINKGAPQGGILSPELFNRYINLLLENLVTPLNIYTFADDICVRNDSKKSLIQTTKELQLETKKNDLKINYDKSGILIISSTKHKFTTYDKRTSEFNDFPIVEEYKYLEITFDKKLSTQQHLIKIE